MRAVLFSLHGHVWPPGVVSCGPLCSPPPQQELAGGWAESPSGIRFPRVQQQTGLATRRAMINARSVFAADNILLG